MKARYLLLGVGLLAVAVFMAGLAADIWWLRIASKPFPMLALMVWLWPRRGKQACLWVLAGLVLSLLGDMLLEVDPQRLFVFGLATFLLAHLAYIGAYLHAERRLRLLRSLPSVLWCAGLIVFLWPQLGKMALPVSLYAVAIGAMVWRAAALLGAPWGWWALLGAGLFALSDSLIAINRFHAPFAGARFAIMVLYWTGQWGITRWATKM